MTEQTATGNVKKLSTAAAIIAFAGCTYNYGKVADGSPYRGRGAVVSHSSDAVSDAVRELYIKKQEAHG